MLAFANVADVLGLPPREVAARSPMGLVSRIEHGLPLGALDRVALLLAPGDAQFKYRLVPKATYERRKGRLRLSSDEGTRLARVARVWGLALDVWGDEARRAISCSARMRCSRTGGRSTSSSRARFGAEMVLDILGSLKYGSAA